MSIPEGIIKPEFERRYRVLMGEEYDKFLQFMATRPKPTIRVNPMKVDPNWLLDRLEREGWELKQVPWYEHGFWVLDGPERLGNTIWHSLGLYYVQEAASMIPPVVLDLEPGQLVLDLAAAPGSKTTQISEMMRWKGLVYANDVTPDRVDALAANVQRMGGVNVLIFLSDGRRAPQTFGREKFDRVLIDAPCSSVGEARRNWGALVRWSPRAVKRISRLQLSLAIAGFETLKRGGIMVYSTCTLEPRENEWVVQQLIERGALIEKPEVKGLKWRPGIRRWFDWEFDEDLEKTMRVYPQDNDTIGFYVAKLRKP